MGYESNQGRVGWNDVGGFDSRSELVIRMGYHKKSRNGYHVRCCTSGLSDSDEEGPSEGVVGNQVYR
jgi:hypothetical protein